MKQEALQFFMRTDLTAYASVLFAVAFIAIIYAVSRKRLDAYFKYMSELPLNKDGKNE